MVWELADVGTIPQAMERLPKLQYKAVRKISGGYHGSHQDLIENIAKVEPVHIKVRDMKVRTAARIVENGDQNDLIRRAEETRELVGRRSWKDHHLSWAPVKKPHYNTSLEEILASMGKNGERELEWEFFREKKQIHTVQSRELGTKDTPRIV